MRPAQFMETLRIDARKLGVAMCWRDCHAVSLDDQPAGNSRKHAGEKWKAGFNEACDRLGHDPCTKAVLQTV